MDVFENIRTLLLFWTVPFIITLAYPELGRGIADHVNNMEEKTLDQKIAFVIFLAFFAAFIIYQIYLLFK